MLKIIDSIKLNISIPARADKIITQHIKSMNPWVSRQILDRWFVEDAFTFDGRKIKASTLLPKGSYQLDIEPEYAAKLAQTKLSPWLPEGDNELFLLQDHPDFFFLNKPSGIPTLPLTPWEDRSVAQMGLALFPSWADHFSNKLQLGVAHRLDEGTSGIVLAAKTEDTWNKLRKLFSDPNNTVQKIYHAYSSVPVQPQIIENEICALQKSKKRMAIASETRRGDQKGLPLPAWTEIISCDLWIEKPVPIYEIKVRIKTGVRHQIRVHLANLGAPLLGDTIYNSTRPQGIQVLRLGLQAYELSFEYEGKQYSCTAPALTPNLLLKEASQ